MKIFTIIKSHQEKFLLGILFFVTVLPRFWGLGYSEFYGDETKTLYWNKTVPAVQFLLDQRKGPLSFAAVWFMEKVSGGFDEFVTRLPFAVAGALSVFVLYLVVKEWFAWRAAFIATFLFSVNGLFIAFSRTAQYQAFIWLFGFMAILLAQKGKIFWSGVFLGLCLLSHYDGLFFVIPVIFTFWPLGRKKFRNFILPAVLIPAVFYLPYLIKGYFSENTVGYLSRRLGIGFSLMDTFFTYSVYNPYVLSIPLVLLGLAFFAFYPKNKVLFAVWFSLPFIIFELIFSDSGTHIQQYIIPLIIMSAFVIDQFLLFSEKLRVKAVTRAILIAAGAGYFYYSLSVFSPAFNKNYPWENEQLGVLQHSLYLYGFPYYRGWNEVAEYLRSSGAQDFYTNDNVTLASYYLLGIPANKMEPEFYVEVENSQLFEPLDPAVFGRYEYTVEKVIEFDGKKTVAIYRRVDVNLPVLPVL